MDYAENKMNPSVIRTAKPISFSDVFTKICKYIELPVELHNCDGSVGAALGAGIGRYLYQCKRSIYKCGPTVIEPDNQQNNTMLVYKME
jgi:xylulokinase